MLQGKFNHEYWMHYALKLAKRAWREGEIPVGAILVRNNRLISKGWNRSISCHDPTAHAEIIAMRHGGIILKNYRLLECTLYVTLEPCIMCYGAMIHGRISTLVYGVHAKKKNANDDFSTDFLQKLRINHLFKVIGGILSPACSKILDDFFYIRRIQKKKRKQ